jgi:hypothetical protein
MSYDDFDPYQQWLGIEPSEHPVDHYRLLGVPRFEDDPDYIATAADERMRHVRSFQTGPRGIHTQRLLNELAAAKLRLLDPESKEEYDARLRAGPSAAETDDPFRDTPDVVLPPEVATTAAETDPMAPLDPNQAFPNAAAPAGPAGIRIDTSGKPARSPRSRRAGKQPPDAAQPGASPVPEPPSLTRNLVTFVVGVTGIAILVWLLGHILPDRSRRPIVNGAVGGSDDSTGRSPSGGLRPTALVVQQADGQLLLTAENAHIEGSTPRRTRQGERTIIQDWGNTEDFLNWRVEIRRGDLFRVHLTYAVDDEAAEGRIRVTLGNETREQDLRPSGGVDSFVTDELMIRAQLGEQTLTLEAVSKPGREVMRFESIRLEPRQRGR